MGGGIPTSKVRPMTQNGGSSPRKCVNVVGGRGTASRLVSLSVMGCYLYHV